MSSDEGTRTVSVWTAKVEIWIAAILVVVAFTVGFVIRGVTTEAPPATTLEQPIPGMPGQIVPAPPLTDDQLQGGIPEGHPTVDENGLPNQQGGDKDKG